jgi:predicted RNA binding protein with dsRBD fold (UPF0201 family)
MSTYSIDVQVTAPVATTEVPDRVARAVEAIFPSAEIEVQPDQVVAEGHAVEEFGERLREQQILDTARVHLRTRMEGDTIRFRLKKQAAFLGDVNFAVGNPDELGDIQVEIRVREPTPEAFLDDVTPGTDDEGTLPE